MMALLARMGLFPTDLRGQAGDERGNALVMMPVGVLIAFGLVGFAIDSTVAWRAQMEAEAVAASLANDAASAVQSETLYANADVVPHGALVSAVISNHQQDSASETLAVNCSGTVTGAVVTVSCNYTVDYVLHMFGFRENASHTATATADLVQN